MRASGWTVDADVPDRPEHPKRNQRLDTRRPAALRIEDVTVRRWGASQRDGHCMVTGRVAGIQGRSVGILALACLVMVGCCLMFVCREPVMMLRMIVVGVGVNVQCDGLNRSRRESQREQRSRKTMHIIESRRVWSHRQTSPKEWQTFRSHV